jgi:hypothetical protein
LKSRRISIGRCAVLCAPSMGALLRVKVPS